MRKTVFVDLNLHSAEDIKDRLTLLQSRAANTNYAFFLSEEINVFMIHLAGFEAEFKERNVQFVVRKQKNRLLNTFLFLFLSLRLKRPDIVLMHGFLHPLHIILCKLILGGDTKIILQNHGEQPYKKVRLIFQRWADKCISRYFFVDKNQAKLWLNKKIIVDVQKVVEVMEGSTDFGLKNEKIPQEGIEQQYAFLWVGRLDKNKDPITVLRAFKEYIRQNPQGKLKMIYGSTDLIKQVEGFISENNLVKNVELLGELNHADIREYYLKANYFILGSHYEGSGYALCEAMACGCVPIVTSIPSFTKMTDNGRCAYLFEPGSVEELKSILINLKPEKLPEMKERVIKQFENELSFKAIATKFHLIIKELASDTNVSSNTIKCDLSSS
jgi:glycosyltransferase involved in cell wall biosynthesis